MLGSITAKANIPSIPEATSTQFKVFVVNTVISISGIFTICEAYSIPSTRPTIPQTSV